LIEISNPIKFINQSLILKNISLILFYQAVTADDMKKVFLFYKWQKIDKVCFAWKWKKFEREKLDP
jgi:hypothetical protein